MGSIEIVYLFIFFTTRAEIKDPEKVTNKMYGCNTDISATTFSGSL